MLRIYSLHSKVKLIKSSILLYTPTILHNKLIINNNCKLNFTTNNNNNNNNSNIKDKFFKMSTSTTTTTPNDKMNTTSSAPTSTVSKPQKEQQQHKYTNKLINEKSPYLLKHAHNPVNWYPWGEEAFKLAREQDKLIFLSVGYMACHWCNVMERECFENPDIAAIMNEHCVNIKIDREERPDIDKIYMTYLTEVSGSGGWPMSIWLTPKLEPITGGTYFAPEAKYGRPGFGDLIKKLDKLWKEDRSMVQERAETFVRFLKEDKKMGDKERAISKSTIEKCFNQIIKGYDPVDGGYSDEPKFPRCSIFNLITTTIKEDYSKNVESLDKFVFTLTKMANGGIYDQIGGGFHRYSVTSDWMIPHFEKMLYDQAQISSVYLDAYQITKNPLFEKIARETLKYVQLHLTHKQGGFFSAEDADSLNLDTNEKSEGAFYIWSFDELKKALTDSESLEIFKFTYGLIENGNVDPKKDPHNEFTDKNIITVVKSIKETANYFKKSEDEVLKSINESKEKLLNYRDSNKPRPQLDDKIIVAWNGLMISSFCKAYQLFKDESYLKSALDSIEFIKSNLFNEETGVLIRNYKDGASIIQGFADDYSFLIQGLLDLYQTTFDIRYLKWSLKLQNKQDQLFYDQINGGYYSTSGLDSSILSRMKEEHDGAEPSSQSITCSNLLKLYTITYKDEYKEKALKTFEDCSLYLEKAPVVVPQMVCSLYLYLNSINSIILSTNSDSKDSLSQLNEILDEIHSFWIPNKFILLNDVAESLDKQFFENNTSNLNLIHSRPIYDRSTFSLCNPNGCTASTDLKSQIKSNLLNQIYP